MTTKQELVDKIDWARVLKAPRYAGGHQEVMDSIFGAFGTVIAEWVEADYQGSLAYAYRFPDGTVAIITDYFGSCSGCDVWEDIGNAGAKRMIMSLVTSARVFPSVYAASLWAAKAGDEAEDYPFSAARQLDFSGVRGV